MEIITINFHPTLDNYFEVEDLLPSSKMHVQNQIILPGGGGLNVSRVLSQLNKSSFAIYFAGGAYGHELALKLSEAPFENYKIEHQKTIRENIVLKNKKDGAEYRFNMPIQELDPTDYFKILPLLAQHQNMKFLVLSGHFGDTIPLEFLQELIENTKKKKVKVLIDSKGIGLRNAFDIGVFLVKPNRREFEMMVGENCPDLASLKAKGQAYISTSATENILISLGKEGALLINKSQTRFFQAPTIEQKNSVGAGDSLLAGVIFKLAEGQSIENSIEFGILCGAATAMQDQHHFCTMETIEKLKGAGIN